MRVATSMILSSLLFGSLAINSQTVHTAISPLMKAKIDAPQLLAEQQQQTKPSPNQPQTPNRHRGSGRKGLQGSVTNINFLV